MSSSNSNSNKVNVPEAREAMDKFKYEVASEIGVPLKKGYNGDLTSAQNGYVGGYMVNIIYTKENICKIKHRTSKSHYMQLDYKINLII
jgi:small, acid-soluble spore proteins, alpha/beta type